MVKPSVSPGVALEVSSVRSELGAEICSSVAVTAPVSWLEAIVSAVWTPLADTAVRVSLLVAGDVATECADICAAVLSPASIRSDVPPDVSSRFVTVVAGSPVVGHIGALWAFPAAVQ